MRFSPPITSRSNARVKALRAAAAGKASKPGELAAIEGENLIGEALRSGLRFDTVYVRQGSEAAAARLDLDASQCIVLSEDVFSSAVDTTSPQGIAALVEIPEPRQASEDGVALVMEAVQDPGNFGTLVRSAEAFGVGQIFATPESASAWNPKAMRASAGSVFRLPVTRLPLDAIRDRLRGYTWFAAVAASEGSLSAARASLIAPCALLVGNEGAGLSATALNLADARVNIPCAVESLNAAIAGSVLMYEAMRQRLAKEQA